MKPFLLIIAGQQFNPSVPREAVRRSGGGRAVTDRTAINGTRLSSRAFETPRRVEITSPGENWVLRSDQVAALQALETSTEPFTVTLGPGYEISGTFGGCTFDGPVIFRPVRGSPEYSTYTFTIHIP